MNLCGVLFSGKRLKTADIYINERLKSYLKNFTFFIDKFLYYAKIKITTFLDKIKKCFTDLQI